MAAVAARELRDGEVVFVGIGLPNLACNLARGTHAPRLALIYESGAVGAVPERLPVSIGDPALVTGSLMVCGMADVFQLFLQNGRIEVGFLGGAQVDRYGNINTTVIGPYDRPTVRLPGSGGEPLGKYFIHGLGHHVGLNVHDASDPTIPLNKGMVFTLEPGIYIPEEKLGVRIEDMFYVDQNGKLVMLTHDLPRTADEVEKAMAK